MSNDEYDMGIQTTAVIALAILTFGALMYWCASCERENQLQQHQRQMECIKQHIYCGVREQ